MRRTDQKR